jgi:hypothetical protein
MLLPSPACFRNKANINALLMCRDHPGMAPISRVGSVLLFFSPVVALLPAVRCAPYPVNRPLS